MKWILISCLCFILVSAHSQTDFWQRTNPPYGGDYPCDIAITSKGYVFTGDCNFFGPQGVFRSADGGNSWARMNSGLPNNRMIYTVKEVSDNLILAGFEWAGIYATTNNGEQWNLSISDTMSSTQFRDIEVAPNKHIFASTAGDGVFRSIDNGVRWQQFLVDTISTGNWLWCVAADSQGTIFVGGYLGIYRSLDDGQTWKRLHLVPDSVSNVIVCLAANKRGDIFAGSNSGLGMFRSTDHGDSWTRINRGITVGWVNELLVNSQGHVFAGANGAMVFRSTDNGDTWVSVSSGLMERLVMSLAINNQGYLFAGTNGEGIFRSMSSTTYVRPLEKELTVNFSLAQNYPNPFNPTTTIKYELPKASHASLRIFDALGQEVAELVNENQDAGYKSLDFNASNLASGVYFYRLQAGDFVQTKKLILLR